MTLAAKRLVASKRLLLSGTPLQNHAVELWSLFDFLMPGYLGSRSHFYAEYARPVHAAEGARAGDAAYLDGEAALAKLHRQVLPFCLRRTKEDVLHELPPKLIEDRLCELHPVQRCLYNAFARSPGGASVAEAVRGVDGSGDCGDDGHGGTNSRVGDGGKGTDGNAGGCSGGVASHVFTALQYLRRVCNHPLLTLNQSHPLYQECVALAKPSGGLTALAIAPKLVALRQILTECGIGSEGGSSEGGGEVEGGGGGGGDGDDGAGGAGGGSDALAAHRALIFSQSGAMLDLVEAHLFEAYMPSVSYLRLDGSVPPAQRYQLATRFNSDPSIDVMLLTTRVRPHHMHAC